MHPTSPTAPEAISQVDRNINEALRKAVEHRGETMADLGRRLLIPQPTWSRKTSNRPGYHRRYTAEELVRIAAAVGLTANDLVSGEPMLYSE